MPFISRNRKYFNNTYENVDRNTPIFASDIEAIDGKEGVSITTNPAFYIMTSTGTNTVSNGYLVTYDLGKYCKGINYINYNPICVPNRYPACILNNVQASPDNKNWVTISSRFGSRNVNSQLDFPTPNNYRFLRFTTSNDDGNYGSGGVNSFKINYIKQELVSSEEGTEDNHNSFIDTDKRLYNFVTNKRHYYKYGTEPNARVVGSFGTVKDKIVKGTSTANYLTIPQEFAPGDNTWEVVYKCNINSYTGSATRIQGTTVDFRFAHVVLNPNGTIQWVLTSNGSSWDLGNATSTAVVPLKTDVWVKQEFTGSEYILSCSLDGKNFEKYVSISSTGKVYAGIISLGILAYTTSVAGLDGTFDLSQSYIKIGEDVTWSGDTYNKVGSWVDCDKGLAGKFTTANYLKLKGTFEPLSYDWEWTFKFTMGSDPTTTFYTFGCTNASGYHGALLGMVSGKFHCWLSSNGTSWNIVSDGTAATSLNANQTYYVKFGWNGTEYYIDLSEDGIEYKRDYTLASTTSIHYAEFNIGNAWGLTVPFSGTIDFNESYIKINGKEWWHGTKAVEIPASEIDNWGTTRYFKNVVTTKNWKEIETTVNGVVYACYRIYASNGWVGWYHYYAKTPIGSSLTAYYRTGDVEDMFQDITNDASQVTPCSANSFTDINETNATLASPPSSRHNGRVCDRYPEGDAYGDVTTTTVVEGTPEDYTYTTEESSIIEVTADDDYDYTELIPSDDFDYYFDQIINYFPVKRSGNAFVPVFESESAGTFNVVLDKSSKYRISIVGGGGAAAMRGVYDDRGYGWSGGSGGAFVGEFELAAGTYSVTVGSANNNTKGQGGNTNTMNPDDTSTHDSYITGIVRVGGGGAGTTSGVGAAGAAATLEIEPLKIELNTAGNAGAYGSGGKGSGANWTHNGAASVYKGYGKGQGCSTSEYASRRYWIAGTNGYVKIEVWSQSEIRSY